MATLEWFTLLFLSDMFTKSDLFTSTEMVYSSLHMRVSKTSILYAILEAHGTDFVLVDDCLPTTLM
jgi:hypothetical protein